MRAITVLKGVLVKTKCVYIKVSTPEALANVIITVIIWKTLDEGISQSLPVMTWA